MLTKTVGKKRKFEIAELIVLFMFMATVYRWDICDTVMKVV